MNTCLPFDECDNGRYVVNLKGISEKLEWILQSNITENEKSKYALTSHSGNRRCLGRRNEWG